MLYTNIVIAGDVCSGKTTIAKGIAQKLKWDYAAAGDYFRQYHLDHHIPLNNPLAIPDDIEKNFDIDFRNRIQMAKNTVFEGHYQGWNAKDIATAFRVLVITNMQIALERVKGRDHTHYETPEDLLERHLALQEHFKKLYGEEIYLNEGYFNCIVDNTKNTAEQSIDYVLKEFANASEI